MAPSRIQNPTQKKKDVIKLLGDGTKIRFFNSKMCNSRTSASAADIMNKQKVYLLLIERTKPGNCRLKPIMMSSLCVHYHTPGDMEIDFFFGKKLQKRITVYCNKFVLG